MKLIKAVIITVTILLIIIGLTNTYTTNAAEMSGKILHVWSHDTSSSYMERHRVNKKLGKEDSYIIEQTVLAKNYSGSAGVALLEAQVSKDKFYSIYWYGGNWIMIYADKKQKNVTDLDMNNPHTYKIEVTKNKVTFYIDGDIVAEFNADIKKIDQVNCGRWDYGSTYDLYIDNVKEYWNGNIINQENFDDGTDNFYTADIYQGSGDSGEEIINAEQIPEFPFIMPVIDWITKSLGLKL